MYNYRYECKQDDHGFWFVTIFCNSDSIFLANTLPSKRIAETYGRAFISGCEYTRAGMPS